LEHPPVKSSSATISIEAVNDARDLDDFIRVPWSIFEGDPNWVPPLLMERKEALSQKHAVFNHLDWQGWVAYRGSNPVGRISAQIDRLHIERYGDATGFFGFLDARDDDALFRALFDTAESWLRERGMRRVRGPFSLNINQEVGLLVEGFDTPPYFMMGHAHPYYGVAIERLDYRKAIDMFAYLISAHFKPPPFIEALIKRLRTRISVRALRRKQLDDDLETVREIFNDAWSDNWGFVPFTREEFRAIGREMLMLVPEEFIQIAEMDGEAVAFIVILPNVNEAIADLNGRLLPLGWIKLLHRLKLKFPATARIPLMGVRKRLHHTRLGPGLAMSVVLALQPPALRRGVEEVEMSWILEDNEGMKNIAESLGGYVSKRYRVYEKDLD
jgi:hypothetical protein